nr:acetyl transferase [Mimivirus sp.]
MLINVYDKSIIITYNKMLVLLQHFMTEFISKYAFSNKDYFTKNNLPDFQSDFIIRKTMTQKYGICMELNYTFHNILRQNGFDSRLIKCYKLNPKTNEFYDIYHLAIIVEISNLKYFVDVGFGEYFVEPVLLLDDDKTGDINVKYIPESHDNYSIYDLTTNSVLILRIVDLAVDVQDINKNYCKFFSSEPCDFPLCRILFERIYNPLTGTFDVVKPNCKL